MKSVSLSALALVISSTVLTVCGFAESAFQQTVKLRPICMAATTTMLGMITQFFTLFFMAMTIVFGLGCATVLTLVVLPVSYAMIFRIPNKQQSSTMCPESWLWNINIRGEGGGLSLII